MYRRIGVPTQRLAGLIRGWTRPITELWHTTHILGTQPMASVALHTPNKGSMAVRASDMWGPGVSDISSNALACALQGCRTLSETKSIHHHIVASNAEQLTFLANHLVRAYDTCGSLRDARKIFDTMIQRNLVSWNIMIAAHAQHLDGDEAIHLLHMMHHQGSIPNHVTIISALHACTSSELWEEARLVHTLVVDSCLVSNNLDNAIFSMYTKCESLQDALNVFEKMQTRTEVSWNAMISAYARDGDFINALCYFKQMVLEGTNPGKATYMTLLNAFDDSVALHLGRIIHLQYLSSNMESDVVLATAFLNMYRKFGSLTDARTLFDNLTQRNLVSWNVMIAAYAQHAHPKEALELFQQMRLEHVMPDGITFVTILNVCTSPAALRDGEALHDNIIKCSLESDALVGSSLVSMYGKCESLSEASALLSRLPDNNLVAWNAMLTGYARHDHAHEAIELFEDMRTRGLMPDRVSLISVIRACSNSPFLEHGTRIHVSILETSFQNNTAVINALVTMYGKCKDAGSARKTFEAMSSHDIISWNALMVAYAQHEDVEEILKILLRMQQGGVKPNKASFAGALDACCCPAALVGGLIMHHQIVDLGLEADVMVGTALVTMYGKCSNLEGARNVFNKLAKHDVVSWSAMIAMYGQHGQGKEAFRVFQYMASGGLMPNKVTYVSILDACASVAALPEGKLVHACFMESELELDVVVGNAFISMYGKCGSLEDATSIFTRMRERDVVTWSALIAATAQHGHGREAVLIFREMGKDHVRPDSITYVSVLSACSHAGLVDDGRRYFDSMKQDHGITATEDHYLCMIDLFGRIGRLEEAEQYLRKIPGRPGIVAWMTLLSSCRLHNNLKWAQYAAERILELDPLNDAVYVMLSNIYSAAGKWEDATKLRKIMVQRGIKKSLGWSSITVDGRVYEFSVGGNSHPQMSKIHSELEKLTVEMKDMGYVPDTKILLHDVSEEEKERLLCFHSERLAIVFGLISTSRRTTLHIIKNLRVCGDCHTATKYISKVTRRVIVVRDANRFHHFENGVCSCGDYW